MSFVTNHILAHASAPPKPANDSPITTGEDDLNVLDKIIQINGDSKAILSFMYSQF